jgi:Putative peptidoglycan binding domain
MKNGYKKIAMLPLTVAIMVLAGCAGTGNDQQLLTQNELLEREKEIESRERLLSAKEVEVNQAAFAQQQAQQQSTQLKITDQSLLPPKAKVGECYARVWVEPTYKQEEIEVKIREASERIELTDAKYQWGQKEVLVKEASSRLEAIPAIYGTETESLLVREERNLWKTDLTKGAAPASDKLLATAKAGGINLESATPGMCFHEHFKPAEYRTIKENVLVSQASKKITTEPAQYEWAEESVLISEASTRIENVPAVFETQKETILDVPAHTIWKKGTGPIQRIDESTGEIMCLVDVPATYKIVTKKVLTSAAMTRTIEIPAKYKTVKVRKMVAGPKQIAQDIPEQYSSVSRQELVTDAEFVWHEIHNMSMSAKTRTGAKICLTNVPAKYKTVTRKVVKTPASTRTIEIPAKYEIVKVKELVSAASEEHIAIPAVFKTVTQKKLMADGYMEWRSILCETNMTRGRISQIQQALIKAGYNPGPVDGDIGSQTISAVNKFQRDKSLPVDKYLNLETLKALGISPK